MGLQYDRDEVKKLLTEKIGAEPSAEALAKGLAAAERRGWEWGDVHLLSTLDEIAASEKTAPPTAPGRRKSKR